VIEPDGAVMFAGAGLHPDGTAPAASDAYRIGSITKTFVATLVLMLVDEGSVDLDADAAQYISRVEVPAGVTVRNLLNHTSGIPNYTDVEGIDRLLLDDPQRFWTPEEIVAVAAGMPFAAPGGAFAYSNTNYILLGILIEEVTGQPFHEVLRERIIAPLGLESTWLAAYESGPEPVGAFLQVLAIPLPIQFDYTAVGSGAWAAGGLVSTAADLQAFFTALFAGELISADALAEMTDTGVYRYGLGLMADADYDVVGHAGSIPGYGTLAVYSPETDRFGFVAVTNELINYSSVAIAVLDLVTTPL
jgi:D-alanyl-D-alanine carboxypeptidase